MAEVTSAGSFRLPIVGTKEWTEADQRHAAIQPPTPESAESHFWGDMGFDGLTDDVWAERKRQLAKRGVQERASGNSPEAWGFFEKRAKQLYAQAIAEGRCTWLDILKEEVYEAFAADTLEHLREELVQVMAVAASWVFDLDRRGTTDGPIANEAQDALDRAEAGSE